MILTVTLNPALDVTYEVDRLVPHASHRVRRHRERAGGKGVNVARVLHQLGHPVTATGLLGGATGDAVRRDLDAAGVAHRFSELRSGETRRTVTVVDTDATVLNETGPEVAAEDWRRFLDEYDDLTGVAGPFDMVVCSGSLPPGVPTDAYGELLRRTSASCLVDATGPALVAAAAAGALLKPNAVELADATDTDDPVAGAEALLERGAAAVVVSLGTDGLLAVTPEGRWRGPVPERLAGNPTGAGDAAAAALAATAGLPWPARLVEAVAWSAAAVPVPHAGEVDEPTLARIRDLVTIEEDPCR